MKPIAPYAAMLAGLLAWPATSAPPTADPVREAAAQPPTDYTTRASQPALLPEYAPPDTPAPLPELEPLPGNSAANQGGLRRCVDASGVTIFTDRRCADLDALDARAPLRSVQPVVPLRVRSCARNQDDLLAGVRAALENHDANRLADYYHWTGMGTAQGYQLMERLASFSERPVVDVQLVSGATQHEYEEPAAPFLFGPQAGDEESPVELPPAPKPRAARLLRVDQMRSDSDAESQVTFFHLLTNAGCWWMRF